MLEDLDDSGITKEYPSFLKFLENWLVLFKKCDFISPQILPSYFLKLLNNWGTSLKQETFFFTTEFAIKLKNILPNFDKIL